MSDKILVPIIVAIVSSNALFSFIQFLISRKDDINKRFDKLDKMIKGLQQGNIRLQFIVLIKLCPDKTEEIMEVARKYFTEFDGNWYCTKLFEDYLKDNNLHEPMWFINVMKKED